MKLVLDFFKKIYDKKSFLLAFIFLASIFFSLIYLSFFKNIGPSGHGVPGNDYLTAYEPMANNILQGKGITVDGVFPTHFAVGFPVILSGIFALSQLTGIEKLDLIVVFNVILTALASCFLFFIAKEIFNKKIALISSFLWLSYPFNLWFIKNPNTEVPFIPLLYIGILFYILTLKERSMKFSFFTGLFLGLASAVRIIGLFLPLFLALLIFFFLRSCPKKIKVLLAVIILIGNLLAIAPWAIYSISKTGDFLNLSNLLPRAMTAGITWLSGSPEKTVISNDEWELVERVKTEDLSSFDKFFLFFGQELVNKPIPLLKLIGLKVVRSWYATSSAWYEKETLMVQLIYLLPGLFGLIYLIKTNKKKILTVFPFLAIVFYFWGMAFFNVSIMRYMIPAMGLIVIFLAITVNIVIDRLVKKFKLYPPCQP